MGGAQIVARRSPVEILEAGLDGRPLRCDDAVERRVPVRPVGHVVWWRRTPSNVAPMPSRAVRDATLPAWVLNSTRSAPSVSKAWVSWRSFASRLAPVRWNAVPDPGPADLQAAMLGRDRHVAGAADRPTRGEVDRRERHLGAGVGVGARRVEPRAERAIVHRPVGGPAPDGGVERDASEVLEMPLLERLEPDAASPVSVTGVTHVCAHGADGSGGRRRRRSRPAAPTLPAMSLFSDTFTGFLDAFLELEPGRGDGDRRPSPRRALARPVAGWPDAPRWRSSTAGTRRSATSIGRHVARRGDRPRPAARGARRDAVRRDRAARGRLGPARLGLPPRRRAVHAHVARVRAAGRSARQRRFPAGVDAAS